MKHDDWWFENGLPIRNADDERGDGPRYVEAIRGARTMRQGRGAHFWDGRPFDPPEYTHLTERQRGIPEGWITR